jgi:low temperature requirement protein LtrA
MFIENNPQNQAKRQLGCIFSIMVIIAIFVLYSVYFAAKTKAQSHKEKKQKLNEYQLSRPNSDIR